MEAESRHVEIEHGVVTIYLGLSHVLQLYAGIFHCTVHEARDHLRNLVGLQGALDRPKWHAHYDQADIPLQAVVLAHGIAKPRRSSKGTNGLLLPLCLRS